MQYVLNADSIFVIVLFFLSQVYGSTCRGCLIKQARLASNNKKKKSKSLFMKQNKNTLSPSMVVGQGCSFLPVPGETHVDMTLNVD